MRAMIVMAVAGALIGFAGGVHAQKPVHQTGGKDQMSGQIQIYSVESGGMITTDRVVKSDEEWRRLLTPEQYRVARGHGTEPAFSGVYWDTKQEGVYRCVACGADLFSSSTKFDSGTGWPSFSAPVNEANIGTSRDRTLWMVRTEVHCARCGAHLGHVFPDGPPPTGLRYCMNSAAFQFVPMAGRQTGTRADRPPGTFAD